MQDVESPYEVRCQSCETSFPLGTRRCIHCGSRIARRRPPKPAVLLREAASAVVAKRAAAGSGTEVSPDPLFEVNAQEEEEEEPSAGPVRAALWALSVGLALVGSMFRVCEGG